MAVDALLRAAAILSLVAIVVASVANFAGWITLDQVKLIALGATVVWFLAATPSLGKADG